MSTSPLQRLRRRVRMGSIPTLVVRAGRAQRRLAMQRLRAAARLGMRPRVELYLAFDDPYAAVALPGLIGVCERQRASLVLLPVVDHGLADDPDASLRRAYALVDAHRLLQRGGQQLARHAPLAPQAVRFVARWAEAARTRGGELAFARAAIDQLWLSGARSERGHALAPDVHALAQAYQDAVGRPPPDERQAGRFDHALAHNAARLLQRGHWETPAAQVGGQWFFAHERLAALEAMLAEVQR